MPFQTRAQRLRLAIGAAAILGMLPGGARVVAQTHTRQVSVESMIYDLKSPDPLRRQTAARELATAKYKAATPQIVALAHDSVDAVRREVELSLERLEDMQALPGFIVLASDPQNDIRSRAVAALVNIHLPRSTGVTAALTKLTDLIPVIPDRDLDIIVEPDVPVDPAVVATLQARIGDSERGIRRTAIRGLGILRAKPAVPDLVQVVREDRDDGLRFESVRALWKIADASAAGELVAMLNINDDAVRHELIVTLGSMRYHGAVAELTRIVEQAKRTDATRILALGALADIADPSSTPLFEKLKDDKDEMLRLYANEGIARTASSSQKTAISAARLVEKSPLVRTAQAFALLRIGEREYLDELIRGLDRKATRELAKEYLLETRAADRRALFAPRSASSTARAELADVLGLMGDPDALPRLKELSHDSDADVARAAERAARRLAVVSGSQ
jgi:HEAT repeat protein